MRQLSSDFVLNAVAAALLVSLIVAGVASLIFAIAAPNLIRDFRSAPLRRYLRRFLVTFVPSFSLASLGFVVGELVGDSREAVVGTVIPAALTLLAGAAVYVVGAAGARVQATVTALLACFAISLLAGAKVGTRLRVEFMAELEQPDRLRQRDVSLEFNRRAVEIQRLQNYVDLLKIQNGIASEQKLDLSKFESAFEKPQDKKPVEPADTKKPSKP
jgi:hypothetical protein